MIPLSCLASLLEFFCVYILAKFITNTSLIPKQIDIIFCLLDILFIGCFPNAPSAYLLFAGQIILILYFITMGNYIFLQNKYANSISIVSVSIFIYYSTFINKFVYLILRFSIR